MTKLPLLIGSHVSFAKKNPHNQKAYLVGALTEAIEYKATAFMIYTGPPQSTRRVSLSKLNINAFFELAKLHNFDVQNIIVHAAYIFNAANPDIEKHNYAVNFLIIELNRAEFVGAPVLVLHPGCAMKSSTSDGIRNCAKTINEAFHGSKTKNIKIALETMAGKGTEIGFKFEHLRDIMRLIAPQFQDRIGVCLDTCHIFDAGYDIKNHFCNVMNELDQTIGFAKVLVLHINDSKFGLNSHKDRHANIDQGLLLLPTLRRIVHFPQFAGIIKILETPWIEGKPPYKLEIALLRQDPCNC